MATITTDTFLDGGVARTAGEAWTMNGGTLTIRTDTRWHANAPAAMTGALGNISISNTLGGGYFVEGRNVRWMPFASGTNTVPAIGTVITGNTSLASGYLLGVYASLTAPPTAVGAAMPTTGFIKFREVTGTFQIESLSGIDASSTGPDVTGWIEVVHNQSTAIAVPRLGNFTIRGDWFYLDNTTGVANQILQIPTNGGGAGTHVPGVWIETAPGSNEFEFWPALVATTMTPANLGTDIRSKFVCTIGSGQVLIGHNGTAACGYVPVSGCRVRVPNVFLRQCATGSRSVNATPHNTLSSRPDFNTTSAGVIDIENVLSDWYHLYSQPYSARHHNFAVFDTFNISECASALDLNNGGVGMYSLLDVYTLNLTSNKAGGTITDCKFQRGRTPNNNDHAAFISFCSGQIFTRLYCGIIPFARAPTGYACYVTLSNNLTFLECKLKNHSIYMNSCFDIVIENLDYCDRYVGSTTTTTPQSVVNVYNGCNNVLVRNITLGEGGAISDVHPYTGLAAVSGSFNVKVRECGTLNAPLSGGTLNNTAFLIRDMGNNSNCKFQRLFLQPTRTAAISSVNSSRNMLFEHVLGDYSDVQAMACLTSIVRGGCGTNSTVGQLSVYGTHWMDGITAAPIAGISPGRLWLALNEPTAETNQYIQIVAGTPKFTSSGGLVMQNVNDEIIFEMNYVAKGIQSFTGDPVVTGTNVTHTSGTAIFGNHSLYYQIDKGFGYNGVWKNFSVTELSAETGLVDGFRIKLRCLCNTTAANNLIRYVRVNTTWNSDLQYYYPLDTAPVFVKVLDNETKAPLQNVRVRIVTSVGNNVILSGLTDVNGELSGETEYIGEEYQGVLRRATDAFGTLYKPSNVTGTVNDDGLSITVLMIPDE